MPIPRSIANGTERPDLLHPALRYLVIESARPDTKHLRESNPRAHVDGAGGSLIE